MTRRRPVKILGVAASLALLALSILGTGGASAAQPHWDMTATPLPATVSPGADAGYRLAIVNKGPGNISKLYLTSSVAAAPTYLVSSRAGCVTTPVLFCSFGALKAGASIALTVAYRTPASGTSFAVTFELTTSGASHSDKGNTSHGDALTRTATTALSSDQNFAGGFIQAQDSTVANNGSLSRQNIQSTRVVVDASSSTGIPASVRDGSGVTFPCVGCSGLIGEWSDVQVAEGQSVPGGLQVVITIYSKSVPSSVSSTTRHHHDDDDDDKPAQVVVYHTYTDAGGTHTDLIEAPCAATPVPDCLTTKRLANGNLQITVYAAHNGGFKGGLK